MPKALVLTICVVALLVPLYVRLLACSYLVCMFVAGGYFGSFLLNVSVLISPKEIFRISGFCLRSNPQCLHLYFRGGAAIWTLRSSVMFLFEICLSLLRVF